MPRYKVIYFGVRGYAETIRMLFAVAGVPYDDRRIDIKDWMEMKPGKWHYVRRLTVRIMTTDVA